MTNEKQITYWNEVAGPKWVKIAHEMDERFSEITAALLASAKPGQGDKILDIGCGTGSVAALFAEAAGGSGQVTGIDISEPMLEVARSTHRGWKNLNFLKADAQVFNFKAEYYDLLISRFGVMFFEDPQAAFRNLLASLVPDGRMCFICWAPLAENPHWTIPFIIVAERLGKPEERPAHAPGPMAFADANYTAGILSQAGFKDITITPTALMILGKSLADETRIASVLGPAGALLDEKKADEITRQELRAVISSALSDFADQDGMKLPATVYVVTASK